MFKIWPKVGDFGWRSTGPKVPIPKEDILWDEKNERMLFFVSSGDVVGIDDYFIILALWSRIAQIIFVPPASNAPKYKLLLSEDIFCI